MIQPITREQLQMLRTPRDGPCVSVLLPTHRRLPEADQDPVRFGNLLRRVESLLGDTLSAKQRRALLEPLERLTEASFWRGQLDGLAVYSSPGFSATYQWPGSLPELAVVADSFHIKPLLRYLQSSERFFALALSQKRVSFYEGSSAALGSLDVAGLPQTAAAALGLEDDETYVNYHSSVNGRRAPLYPGHGLTNEPNQKDNLAQFFRVIDAVLWDKVLRYERAPLILLGVDYLLPIYRSVSRYEHITEAGVEGNFDMAGADEIHRQIWPVVENQLRLRVEAALSDFGMLAARGLASEQLEAIGKAGSEARVDRLFIAEGAHLWGIYDRESGALELRSAQLDEHDDDVLDDLAECVLDQGGEVYFLSREAIPGGAPAAAILRW